MKPVTDWNTLPVLLDVPLAARVLGVCGETVKRACQRGELPGKNIGGRNWRIPRDRLRAYVEGESGK